MQFVSLPPDVLLFSQRYYFTVNDEIRVNIIEFVLFGKLQPRADIIYLVNYNYVIRTYLCYFSVLSFNLVNTLNVCLYFVGRESKNTGSSISAPVGLLPISCGLIL